MISETPIHKRNCLGRWFGVDASLDAKSLSTFSFDRSSFCVMLIDGKTVINKEAKSDIISVANAIPYSRA